MFFYIHTFSHDCYTILFYLCKIYIGAALWFRFPSTQKGDLIQGGVFHNFVEFFLIPASVQELLRGACVGFYMTIDKLRTSCEILLCSINGRLLKSSKMIWIYSNNISWRCNHLKYLRLNLWLTINIEIILSFLFLMIFLMNILCLFQVSVNCVMNTTIVR